MMNIRFMIVASSLFLSTFALADVDKKTERLWKAKCSACHGQEGKGDTDKGQQMKIADMTTAAYQAKSDDEMKKAILNGVHTEKGGVKQDMNGFKDDLTPDQVNALVAYIRTLKK
ncbi:MAG: c-type cytochrome [Myxococcaceae bacterium]